MPSKEMFKSVAYDSLDKQVDGTHYKGMKIQPAHFINENHLEFAEGNAIKYICRHKSKGKSKENQRRIKGKSHENQREIKGKSNENQKKIKGKQKEKQKI